MLYLAFYTVKCSILAFYTGLLFQVFIQEAKRLECQTIKWPHQKFLISSVVSSDTNEILKFSFILK